MRRGRGHNRRMERGNWFVALPVDAGEWYSSGVPPTPQGTRRFAPGDLHLTVAFLGAVGRARAMGAWAAALEQLGRRPASPWAAAPFQVSLGAAAPMGNPKRATALAALLEHGRREVEAAIGAAREELWAAADARRDSRPVKAHLSLARIQRGASEVERAAALGWADAIDLAGVRLVLDRLALYAWSEDRLERQFAVVTEARF